MRRIDINCCSAGDGILGMIELRVITRTGLEKCLRALTQRNRIDAAQLLTFFDPSGVAPALVWSSYVHTTSTTSPCSFLTTLSQVITYAYLSRTCPPGSNLLKPLGGGIVPSTPVSKKSSLSMYTLPLNGMSLVPSSALFGCLSATKFSTLSMRRRAVDIELATCKDDSH